MLNTRHDLSAWKEGHNRPTMDPQGPSSAPAGLGYLTPEPPERSFGEYLDIFIDHVWLIGGCLLAGIGVAVAYANLATPVYQSTMLVQVETDRAGSAKAVFGEAASLYEGDRSTAAEIELIRSRMVLNEAVDRTRFHTEAKPRYLPLFGRYLASRATNVTEPIHGYVFGKERLELDTFEVPSALLGRRFVVEADPPRAYRIGLENSPDRWKASVGEAVEIPIAGSVVKVRVSKLEAAHGALFDVVRHPRDAVVSRLQTELQVTEKTRGSGMIAITYKSPDPEMTARLLNEIGALYVRQNLARKSEEAQKGIQFLSGQLPQYKALMEQAESAFNAFQMSRGTVDLGAEAKVYFEQSLQSQNRLLELRQKRRELSATYTDQHPSIVSLDEQIAALGRFASGVEGKFRSLPSAQQEAVRLMRELEMNTQRYRSTLESIMQLEMVSQARVGSARLVDEAILPRGPVWPNKGQLIGWGAMAGLALGLLAAAVSRQLWSRINDASEVEEKTGLGVFGVVPMSPMQKVLADRAASRTNGIHVLAHMHRHDPAIESMRSLRTSLMFAMLETHSNVVLITGPTAGVGKSFVSVNLAAVLGASGKRVLLIDADLRKGHLHQYFGVRRTDGLSEVLTGTRDVHDNIHRSILPGLDLLTTGELPTNPADLVVSRRYAEMVQDIASRYDVVLIDTPPVLVASDAAAMATSAGLVFVVARSGKSQLGEVSESIRRIVQSGASVTGAIFNGLDMGKRRFRYGYASAYGYGHRYRYGAEHVAQVRAYAPQLPGDGKSQAASRSP